MKVSTSYTSYIFPVENCPCFHVYEILYVTMHRNPSLGKTTYKQDIEYEETFFFPFWQNKLSFHLLCLACKLSTEMLSRG